MRLAAGLVFSMTTWLMTPFLFNVPVTAFAFTLILSNTEPSLMSGQSIPVTIEIPEGAAVREVRYYWYRDDDEPIGTSQAKPALTVTRASDPPYGGMLKVPDDAIGLMRLLAVGTMGRGRLAGREDFDERVIRVEPSATLVGIEFAVEKPWRLETIGNIVPVPVIGRFSDHVERYLGGGSAGSRYFSSDVSVVQVSPSGLAHVVGNGRAKITVQNRGQEATLEVVILGDESPNRAPTAKVPPRIETKGGQVVMLDGLQSSDPDGDPLRYEWKQSRGNRVALMNADEAKAMFTAPLVSARRQLQFKLRVTDMRGPDAIKGADSDISTVDVWIDP